MPRLVKLVAQTHGLLALQSSDVPPDSHKMAVATPDITPSFTYGQMLQCLSPFYQRERPFLESPEDFICISLALRESVLINIVIGKGEWNYHNWFRPLVQNFSMNQNLLGALLKCRLQCSITRVSDLVYWDGAQ